MVMNLNLLESRRRILLTTPHLESPTPANPLTFKSNMTTKLKEEKVYFTPVQEGTGDPSPDNVRPILGWDGITVTKCGKNLFDKNSVIKGGFIGAEGVSTGSGGTWGYVYVPVKGLTKITVSGSYSSSAARFVFFDKDMNPINTGTSAGTKGNKTLTVLNNAYYLAVSVIHDLSRTYADINTIQLEEGSTPTAYEPYTETKITIPFPKTIYGGYVDLVKGEIVETDGEVQLTNPSRLTMSERNKGNGNYFYKTLNPHCLLGAGAMSQAKEQELYSHGTIDNPWGQKGNYVWCYNATFRIGFEDEMNINSVNDLNAWLDDVGGVTIVYPLATPNTYPLDPQVIRPLKGVNNIYSDANGNIEIKFWRH